MGSPEGSVSPPTISQVANAVRTTARSSLSPLRHQPLARASTFSDAFDSSRLRRTSSLGSTFSDSIDDARHSIKSTTDDLLLPKVTSPDAMAGLEPSHWHSVPLALALLPAAAGLFFEKGSIVITDITLLGLAAIFLNWSLRLPWDWYHSAQAIDLLDDCSSTNGHNPDTILEEDDNDNESSQQSRPTSPVPSSAPPKSQSYNSSAASELRVHELLALLTCFMSPLVGAWLLHHIRAQLSRPSEGLVSNYNLTIFLLASELRPLSHLIKLVQARTLHLQRSVSVNPHGQSPGSPPLSPSTISELHSRLTELETHVTDTVPSSLNTPSKLLQSQLPDVTAQIRKSLQPDLDALNRAVRRYEKRATLLSMQTEKRLQDLESRMNDAITLAAAAERSSQSNRQRQGSGVVLVVDWMTKAVLLPLQVAWSVLSLPAHVASAFVGMIDEVVRGKISNVGGKKESRSGTSGSMRNGNEKRRIQMQSGIGSGMVTGKAGKKAM